MSDKNLSAKQPATVRKPNPFVYYPIVGVVKLLSKLIYRVSVDKKALKGEKGPFVVIGNHSSVMDIVFIGTAFLPRRVNVVAGRDLFTWKILKPFLKPFGVIPKNQFGLDVASIRMMCDAVKNGCTIIVYPEGKTSLDGTNLSYLPPSIGKFLKMTDATVVCANSLGAYLTKPRFQKGFNYGKVKIKLTKLIGREELRQTSPKDIYEKVVAGISFNDNIYQQLERVKFRSKKPARNLEYILYKCPKCGAEYAMTTTDRDIICEHCGNTVTYDNYGVLTPKDDGKAFERLDVWYGWERACVKQELIEKGDAFRLSDGAELIRFDPEKKKWLKTDEGEFWLTRENVGFDGEKEHVSMSIKEMHTITTKNEEGIDLVFGDEIWRFPFKAHKHSTKYGLAVEENFKLNHNID